MNEQQMREKLALLDPVLRKLWAAHGSVEGAERYQEIEREWAYAMELMDEMLPTEWSDDDDLSPLPCGCHRLPPLACAAARAHANPFAPWDGPVCDCPCHSGGVVVEAGK